MTFTQVFSKSMRKSKIHNIRDAADRVFRVKTKGYLLFIHMSLLVEM
jgi:hypothetical protein